MKRLSRTIVGVALGTVLMTSAIPMWNSQPANAAILRQDNATATSRGDLAATTLTVADLPDGFTFVGETFLTAEEVAVGTFDPATLQDAGFQSQYLSVYENRGQNMRIRSYVSSWSDDGAAEAGFGILEDESVTSPGAVLTDGETEAGEDPRETTTGTYTASDGTTVSTIDITFRRGSLVAGVALETLDGSEVNADNAKELARRMDERVQQVLRGESPSMADLNLPGTVLSLGDLGQDIQVGFLGPAEVEHMYGLRGSVLDKVQSSWVESVMLGGGESGGPTITISVSTFDDAANAADAVKNADQLAVPLANQATVEDVSLEGADEVRSFRFTSPGATVTDAIDSYRIVFATGTSLVAIDVQGASSEQVATDSAMALAQAQVGCLGGSCELPELPGELTGAA